MQGEVELCTEGYIVIKWNTFYLFASYYEAIYIKIITNNK